MGSERVRYRKQPGGGGNQGYELPILMSPEGQLEAEKGSPVFGQGEDDGEHKLHGYMSSGNVTRIYSHYDQDGGYLNEHEQKGDQYFNGRRVEQGGTRRRTFTKKNWMTIILLVLFGAFIRLWRLKWPTQVVFDEVHFGKHAGMYINQTYFMDVHPPLAKMSFAAVGKLGGYDGVFDFKTIGLEYGPTGVPYVFMRLFAALAGLMMVPITYITIAVYGGSDEASLFGAIAVMLENSYVTISRYILLDSTLLFYTGLTTMFWGLFLREEKRPFSKRWWVYLVATGMSLGNTMSSKWVGLFLVASIGLWTVGDLWNKVTDYRVSMRDVGKHILGRAIGLIAVPIAVYMFWFAVHFRTLHKSGSGDAFMSPEFQGTLDGMDKIQPTFQDVYYGSVIRLRHHASNNGYLHSHASKYTTGSKQQQITLYGYRDDNNYWVIERTQKMHKKALENGDIKKLVPVKAGEVIRLRHVSTRRCLHSHDKRAPVTTKDYHNEVSGYGDDEFQGDDNDDWIVRIIEGNKNVPDSTKRLMSIHSKFRLIHRNQRCALYSNRVKLPKWAFEQTEVTCMKNAKVPRTLWRIESASHPSMPQDAPIAKYETPGFLAKLVEAHKVMLRVNNGLTSSHFYESRPHTWPWMRRGIGYWSTKTNAVYLLGNPIVWLLSLASVALFAVVQAVLALRDKRGYRDQLGGVRNVYFSAGGFFAISWALHYFPFFIMKRQLFIHHYLPALWFSILLFIFTVDLSTRRLKAGHKNIVYIVLTLLIFNAFYRLSPLSYGSSSWSESSCKRSKYFSSWDYDCSKYRPQPPVPPPSRPQQKQQDAPPIPAAEDPAVHLNNDQVKPVDNLDAELSLNKIAPKLNSDEQLKIEQEKLMFKDEYKDKDKKDASESSSSGADSAVAAAPVSASSNDADDAPHD